MFLVKLSMKFINERDEKQSASTVSLLLNDILEKVKYRE